MVISHLYKSNTTMATFVAKLVVYSGTAYITEQIGPCFGGSTSRVMLAWTAKHRLIVTNSEMKALTNLFSLYSSQKDGHTTELDSAVDRCVEALGDDLTESGIANAISQGRLLINEIEINNINQQISTLDENIANTLTQVQELQEQINIMKNVQKTGGRASTNKNATFLRSAKVQLEKEEATPLKQSDSTQQDIIDIKNRMEYNQQKQTSSVSQPNPFAATLQSLILSRASKSESSPNKNGSTEIRRNNENNIIRNSAIML